MEHVIRHTLLLGMIDAKLVRQSDAIQDATNVGYLWIFSMDSFIVI